MMRGLNYEEKTIHSRSNCKRKILDFLESDDGLVEFHDFKDKSIPTIPSSSTLPPINKVHTVTELPHSHYTSMIDQCKKQLLTRYERFTKTFLLNRQGTIDPTLVREINRKHNSNNSSLETNDMFKNYINIIEFLNSRHYKYYF